MEPETEVVAAATDAISVRFGGIVSKLELGPEDLLVIELPDGRLISQAERECLKQQIATALPGRKIIVLEGGIRLGVLNPKKEEDDFVVPEPQSGEPKPPKGTIIRESRDRPDNGER